jgi:hypothetical protein
MTAFSMPRLRKVLKNRRQAASKHKELMLASVFVIALLSLGACGPRKVAEIPDVSTVQSAAKSAPENGQGDNDGAETASAPTKSIAAPETSIAEREPAAASGDATRIAGGWVNAGGACDSGAAVMFNRDGTFMSEGERGTWSLDGKTLIVTTASTEEDGGLSTQGPDESTGDVGEKSVLTVLSITDDTVRVVLANGSPASWTRCTG